MSRRLAPSALRRPISRVRSLTTISMMFMITMPPTTSDSATTPTSTAKMPLVAVLVDVEERVGREHAEVVTARSAAAAAGCASPPSHRPSRPCTSSGDFGLTRICMPMREPNIFWKSPSGMIANLSCDLPKTEPFFSLTPTTRKCMAADLTRPCRSDRPDRTVVGDVCHPSTVTGRLRSISAGLISRPRSTLKVEKYM